MRAFLFGHSHAWCLRSALETFNAAPRPADDPSFSMLLCGTKEFPGPLVSEFNARPQLNAALVSAWNRVGATSEDVVVSAVQGNQYNSLVLLEENEPFDICVPGWPRPPFGPPPVPYGAFRKMFEAQFEEFGSFVKRVSTMKFKRFLHIGPPPPIPDNNFIRERLATLEGDKPVTVSSPELRLKAWTIQNEILKGILTRHSAEFVPPPAASRDDQGFLKREFWKDSVHANTGYGMLLLETLRDELRTKEKATT